MTLPSVCAAAGVTQAHAPRQIRLKNTARVGCKEDPSLYGMANSEINSVRQHSRPGTNERTAHTLRFRWRCRIFVSSSQVNSKWRRQRGSRDLQLYLAPLVSNSRLRR